jgi:hypothetical protein
MALPTAQAAPEMTPMLLEMLKFGVTAFKAGKQLEGIIDQTADDMKKQYEATKGQPKPPPVEMQKAQMDNQSKMQQIQMQAQIEQAKLQGQMELEKAKQEYQAQENQLKFQLEEQRNQRDAEMEMVLAKQKTETENNKEILIAYLDNATKIESARISAGLDDGTEAYIENVEQAKIMQDNMGYSQMATHPLKPAMDNMHQSNQELAQMLAILLEKMHQPKEIVRDENGKIVGVR